MSPCRWPLQLVVVVFGSCVVGVTSATPSAVNRILAILFGGGLLFVLRRSAGSRQWGIRPGRIGRLTKMGVGFGLGALVASAALFLAALTSSEVWWTIVLWALGLTALAIWADRWERRTAPWFQYSSHEVAPPPGLVKEDQNAQFFSDRGGFLWRKRIWFAATGIKPTEFAAKELARLDVLRWDEPIPVICRGRMRWWWFGERFYSETEGYRGRDVKALVLQQQRRKERRLEHAHDLMAMGEFSRTREPIPQAVRRLVFRRDGGRCVKCGRTKPLEFDHIIPLALGGASTVDNIQVLCTDCNREKGDSLG